MMASNDEPAANVEQQSHSTHTTNMVQLCGSSSGPCGYCNGRRAEIVDLAPDQCSRAYGILTCSSSLIAPSDYEALLHRGWRRSGIHIYKPDNWNSCCPALTIRLRTPNFRPTKSQKRVVSKLERALQGVASNASSGAKSNKKTKNTSTRVDPMILQKLESATFDILKRMVPAEYTSLLSSSQPNICKFQHKSTRSRDTTVTTVVCKACAALQGMSKGVLERSTLAKTLAAALLELTPSTEKSNHHLNFVRSASAHEESGQVLVAINVSRTTATLDADNDDMSISSTATRRNPVKEWLQSSKEPPYSLVVTTMPAHESALQYPDVHKLYLAYQQAVHGDPDPLDSRQQQEQRNNEQDQLDWGQASSDYISACQRMLQSEYPTDQVDRMTKAFCGFYNFLVESPLPHYNERTALGTVHQHYRIDGKLIAVGVVDLLPGGLSSVYAFYDPTQRITSMGKYMSLREIEFAFPRCYYLGFYIQSCPKMRYKAEYKPSELLCPTHYKWVDAALAQEMLLRDSPQRHCCVLYRVGSSLVPLSDKQSSDDENKGATDSNGNRGKEQQQREDAVMDGIRLAVGAPSFITLSSLHQHGQAIVRPILQEFVQQMGPELAARFIVKLV